jgi:hypothetical protein
MRPLIEVGDRILVKKARAKEIRPGDVILFKRDGAFVTHRLLKISEVDGKQMILQKGDAGGIPDTIPGDSVIGRVTVVEKGGKPLRLDTGRLGALNHLLGLNSGCSYRIGGTLFVLKKWLRDKPGFPCQRLFYRVLKWPFGFFNRTVTRALMRGSDYCLRAPRTAPHPPKSRRQSHKRLCLFHLWPKTTDLFPLGRPNVTGMTGSFFVYIIRFSFYPLILP